MNAVIDNLNRVWPQLLFIGAVLWILFTAYFDQQVTSIAQREIASAVPVTSSFVGLKDDVADLSDQVQMAGGTASHNSENISRIEATVIRVEDKLDSLILIMSQNGS